MNFSSYSFRTFPRTHKNQAFFITLQVNIQSSIVINIVFFNFRYTKIVLAHKKDITSKEKIYIVKLFIYRKTTLEIAKYFKSTDKSKNKLKTLAR